MAKQILIKDLEKFDINNPKLCELDLKTLAKNKDYKEFLGLLTQDATEYLMEYKKDKTPYSGIFLEIREIKKNVVEQNLKCINNAIK